MKKLIFYTFIFFTSFCFAQTGEEELYSEYKKADTELNYATATQELEILKRVLRLHISSEDFINVLIDKIKENLSDRESITPNFIYTMLSYDLGKSTANQVSEDFENAIKTGEYKTKLQRFLDRSPWMK